MRKAFLLSAIAAFCLMFAAQVHAERSGKDVYEKTCKVCHDSGVAGAPKFGDKAWLDLLKKDGLDMLVEQAVKGKGAMPPKGSCGDCSSSELKSAVQYLIDSAKTKKPTKGY